MITLLTDFGSSDSWVGEMKGVMLGIDPSIPIVDVTHGITAGGIREAAWILSRAWEVFPAGTIHVAVVDPGVGGERRGIAARAGGHWFVGPDNGVLIAAIDRADADPAAEIREITLRELGHVRRGTTFDGRDLFAPTAARLHGGLPFLEIGPEISDPVRLPGFAPRPKGEAWSVEIARVDRFGNLVTVADEGFLRAQFGDDWRDVSVELANAPLRGISLGYGDVAVGETLLSIGGAGTLEISVNRGSARASLGLVAGDTVLLNGPPSHSSGSPG
ncbi:MAG: hypothetical protein DHS20C21_12550 [Gemmatimonadota bacterium]|nr:MAG: hypothetical protein DHS20C21_12550 [Gemmatimonadota bacterium]